MAHPDSATLIQSAHNYSQGRRRGHSHWRMPLRVPIYHRCISSEAVLPLVRVVYNGRRGRGHSYDSGTDLRKPLDSTESLLTLL